MNYVVRVRDVIRGANRVSEGGAAEAPVAVAAAVERRAEVLEDSKSFREPPGGVKVAAESRLPHRFVTPGKRCASEGRHPSSYPSSSRKRPPPKMMPGATNSLKRHDLSASSISRHEVSGHSWACERRSVPSESSNGPPGSLNTRNAPIEARLSQRARRRVFTRIFWLSSAQLM